MATTIGFVGLGNMGGPMVARLLAAGYTVHVFDIDATALQSAVDAGATASASAAECAALADVFMTSLPRPDHVAEVMLENKALNARGLRNFIHSSSADDVIPKPFVRIELKHRNMLVGGSVKNKLRLVLTKDAGHPAAINNVCEEAMDLYILC